ncbi:MAG: hypothetical protein ACR2PM_07405 [Hyphomicrobiales bacterium]
MIYGNPSRNSRVHMAALLDHERDTEPLAQVFSAYWPGYTVYSADTPAQVIDLIDAVENDLSTDKIDCVFVDVSPPFQHLSKAFIRTFKERFADNGRPVVGLTAGCGRDDVPHVLQEQIDLIIPYPISKLNAERVSLLVVERWMPCV